MMVIMKPGHTAEEFEDVMKRIKEDGLDGHPIRGVERTVIGVVGLDRLHPELADDIEVMPGVEATVQISSPYKLCSREFKPDDTIIDVNGVKIGQGTVTVIAGPCAVESEEQLMQTARAMRERGASMLRGGAFKPRTSPYSFRGLELEGLKLLAAARKETGLPVVTEVMSEASVQDIATYADVLQIGTRNAQNFFLLEEVAKAGKPVLLKRGMSSSIQEWLLAAEYILAKGNRNVILCERGIRTFETAARNTMDINAIPLVKEMSHLPVVADPSHGTGKRKLVEPVSLGMVAAGADGLILEVHPDPEHALSDGAQSLTFDNFSSLMDNVAKIANAVGKRMERSAVVA
ncbi:MAG: 3-deoxy-7-phosphoheptulonate synthase [Chloroflexota bacterium]|nr:3-deoxy-7-phosphoheptulonate synthase [Chloroflexota bacterium]